MTFYGIAPILYLITGLIFLAGTFLACGKNISIRSFTNPIVGFSLTFTIYYLLAPVGPLLTATHMFESMYQQDTPVRGLLLYLLFYISVLGTYYMTAGKTKGDSIPEANTWQLPRLSAHMWVSIGLGVIALLALIRQLMLIASVGVTAFLIDRIKLQAGNQQFIFPMNFFAVIAICSFTYAMAAKAQGIKSSLATQLTWVSLVFALAAGFSTGSRTRALLPILLVCIAYLLLSDPGRKARRLAVLGVFGLAVIGAFALQDIRADLMSRLRRDVQVDSGAFNTVLLRSFPEYENTWWLLEHESEFETSNGVTLMAALTIPMPRQMWPDKPYGGAVMMRNLIRPGTYNPNSGKPLSAYTTGVVAEGILSFGQIGVIVAGIIIGIFLRLVNTLRIGISSPYDFAIWLVCYYRVLELQRSEFMGGIANALYALVGLLIMRRLAMGRTPPAPHLERISLTS